MITVPKLLILLAIIVVVFGTTKLRNIGEDLGGAIKSFRNAIRDGEDEHTQIAETEAVSTVHEKA